MLEKIKKGLAGIASTACTRKLTSLNKLDTLVFEDIEQEAKQLLEVIADHEKQLRREQRENEKNGDIGHSEQQQPATVSTKAKTAKPRAKRTTTKKRLSTDKKPSRKQK